MKVGDIYDIFFSDRNINNTRIEIRAIVDDEWIVVKRKSGFYKVEHISYFDSIKKYMKEVKQI